MPLAPVIHIVDDDESFRSSVAVLLKAAGYEVRTYANAGDFLLAGVDQSPGCILLDVHMPGTGGLELQKGLAARPDSPPVIFLTGEGDIPTSVSAMKAGAVDFLTKPVKRDILFAAVENALARDAKKRASRERVRRWSACYETLTPREREVFHLVVSGKMNKEISAETGAAERTVKAHRSQVMQKMQVDSLAELVRVADLLRLHGVIRPDKT